MIFKKLRQALANRWAKELAEVQEIHLDRRKSRKWDFDPPEAGSLWRLYNGDLAFILNVDRCVITMLMNGSKFQDDIWSFHENFVPLINKEVSDGCK